MKRPGREDNHSSPSSAEVKNDGVISPLPPYLHGVINYLNRETAFTVYAFNCDSHRYCDMKCIKRFLFRREMRENYSLTVIAVIVFT